MNINEKGARSLIKEKKGLEKPRDQILHWVHRIEKINANSEENRSSLKGERESNQLNSVQKINPSSNNGNITNEDELCFKGAQLLTELLLMIFAACLLLIALVVIFSKKIPAFMEYYDVVPKFLFFLCVIIAICSLIRWILSEIQTQLRPKRATTNAQTTTTKSTGQHINEQNSISLREQMKRNDEDDKVSQQADNSFNSPTTLPLPKSASDTSAVINDDQCCVTSRKNHVSLLLGKVNVDVIGVVGKSNTSSSGSISSDNSLDIERKYRSFSFAERKSLLSRQRAYNNTIDEESMND